MFKHLLVPLDGSTDGRSGAAGSAFLAEKLRARVTLMHVVERNAPNAVHGQPHLQDAEEAAAYLKEVSQRIFPERVQVDCHVHEAQVTDVAASIVAHAGELKYDLVVMCSHGRGKALHLFLGSIAQKVAANGSLPVLITFPAETGNTTFACQSILVPLDADPDHAQALPPAGELAAACGATLQLVMAVPSLGTLSGEMMATGRLLPATTTRMLEMALQEAEANLQARVQQLRQEGVAAEAHVLQGDPAKMIVDAASESRADLVVLATHGKTGMEAFWEGSVTHQVISRCRIPLLVIPVKRG